MDIQYRFLKKDDAEKFITIRQLALTSNPDEFGATLEEEKSKTAASLKEKLQQQDFWILGAFDKEELIGIIGLLRENKQKTQHKGMIWGMFVSAAYKGKGIGFQLLDRIVQHAKQQKMERLLLFVISTNEKAIRLYKQYGFVIYGTEAKAYKKDQDYFDVNLMALALA